MQELRTAAQDGTFEHLLSASHTRGVCPTGSACSLATAPSRASMDPPAAGAAADCARVSSESEQTAQPTAPSSHATPRRNNCSDDAERARGYPDQSRLHGIHSQKRKLPEVSAGQQLRSPPAQGPSSASMNADAAAAVDVVMHEDDDAHAEPPLHAAERSAGMRSESETAAVPNDPLAAPSAAPVVGLADNDNAGDAAHAYAAARRASMAEAMPWTTIATGAAEGAVHAGTDCTDLPERMMSSSCKPQATTSRVATPVAEGGQHRAQSPAGTAGAIRCSPACAVGAASIDCAFGVGGNGGGAVAACEVAADVAQAQVEQQSTGDGAVTAGCSDWSLCRKAGDEVLAGRVSGHAVEETAACPEGVEEPGNDVVRAGAVVHPVSAAAEDVAVEAGPGVTKQFKLLLLNTLAMCAGDAGDPEISEALTKLQTAVTTRVGHTDDAASLFS